jgi:hypothetical protein
MLSFLPLIATFSLLFVIWQCLFFYFAFLKCRSVDGLIPQVPLKATQGHLRSDFLVTRQEYLFLC